MKTGLESLEVGAPDITYSGNQGPKSPQEDQRMMQEHLISQIEEEYSRHVFEMEEQGLQPMSMQEFMQQVLAEGQMSSNEEPTMGDMAGGENDRVRELLLLEETQGLSEEEKEELRQLIKTISAQMPQGDMPMDMEQDPRTMAAGGGIMDTEKGFAMQAGVKNYLGKQKTVSDVPVKWQSGKDKPSTELAYITDAEKKLLVVLDQKVLVQVVVMVLVEGEVGQQQEEKEETMVVEQQQLNNHLQPQQLKQPQIKQPQPQQTQKQKQKK